MSAPSTSQPVNSQFAPNLLLGAPILSLISTYINVTQMSLPPPERGSMSRGQGPLCSDLTTGHLGALNKTVTE